MEGLHRGMKLFLYLIKIDPNETSYNKRNGTP